MYCSGGDILTIKVFFFYGHNKHLIFYSSFNEKKKNIHVRLSVYISQFNYHFFPRSHSSTFYANPVYLRNFSGYDLDMFMFFLNIRKMILKDKKIKMIS